MTLRVLVLGEGRYRGIVAERLGAEPHLDVDDCDPALGDCVMYVRLEGVRYDAFVFVDYDAPVTRGALATVAERAVLVPLLDRRRADPDPLHDGYLFRLPRALGFRTEDERAFAHEVFPKAVGIPSELVDEEVTNVPALTRLVSRATSGRWEWAEFVERVADETRSSH